MQVGKLHTACGSVLPTPLRSIPLSQVNKGRCKTLPQDICCTQWQTAWCHDNFTQWSPLQLELQLTLHSALSGFLLVCSSKPSACAPVLPLHKHTGGCSKAILADLHGRLSHSTKRSVLVQAYPSNAYNLCQACLRTHAFGDLCPSAHFLLIKHLRPACISACSTQRRMCCQTTTLSHITPTQAYNSKHKCCGA